MDYFIILFLFLFLFWLCHVACGILVPRPGIEPALSTVTAPIPNHGTAREFPWIIVIFFYKFYLFIYLFIYLFMAALGLRCCAQAFTSCGEWGLLLVAVRELLIAVASLAAEHGL